MFSLGNETKDGAGEFLGQWLAFKTILYHKDKLIPNFRAVMFPEKYVTSMYTRWAR
jgi:hypothetical protein